MDYLIATLTNLQFETKGLYAYLDSFFNNLKELVLNFFISIYNCFKDDNIGEDLIPIALEIIRRAVRQIQ
ncbi:unnamed protein product [Diplocarpon coronariae]